MNRVQVVKKANELLKARKSPLAGLEWYFIVFGEEYGVDGRLAIAISGAETQFGTDPKAGQDITTGHNAWGYGPHRVFPTWRYGIKVVTSDLGLNYIAKGLDTIDKIEERWVGYPAPNWKETVRWVYSHLGGNPDARVTAYLHK